MTKQAPPTNLAQTFEASVNERKTAKRAAPFSLRLTADERAYLEAKAGSRPLGSYIRKQLLADVEDKRRSQRKPSIDQQTAALLLARLGESRIANNLNQIAKAANCGTLDTTKNVEEQLQEAYDCVLEMRKALLMTLGLRFTGDTATFTNSEDQT